MKKPRVITKCVANNYSMPNERIIEFTFPDGEGGLIQFATINGENRVTVYQHDQRVKVVKGKNSNTL